MKTIKFILVIAVLLFVTMPIQAQEIITAATAGNLEKVKELVEKDPQLVNVKDATGRTPLHWAARGVHFEVLKYLVEKGADVNALDNNQVAPLHSIASRNHLAAATLLVEKGAKIDILSYNKQTPLHMAAGYGNKEVAEYLVKKGADLKLRDGQGRTPLLVCARERGGPVITKILIDAGADINAKSNSNETALELAAWRGYKEIVDILLSAGAEVPVIGFEANELLQYACNRGLWNLFQLLVTRGGDLSILNGHKGSLLHEAAKGGAEEIINLLIDKKLDINQKDRNGWTPLHYAVINRHINAVLKLIEKGADINLRTTAGQSALNIAEENQADAVIKLLVDKGADRSSIQFPVLKGDYLGQKQPGKLPEIFAPGIVSSIWGLHSSLTVSQDGNEIYWSPMVTRPGQPYSVSAIFSVKRVNGIWSSPQITPFANYILGGSEPFLSYDGKKLFFNAVRPNPQQGGQTKENIWYVERTNDGWSSPMPVDNIINNMGLHWQFSLDKKGNIFFASDDGGGKGMWDIYSSKLVNGKYEKPVNLGPAVNSSGSEDSPYISPEGDYLIFTRGSKLYISFLINENSWSTAKILDPEINKGSSVICPNVAPDGKFMFYLKDQSAYWVNTSFIEKMKHD